MNTPESISFLGSLRPLVGVAAFSVMALSAGMLEGCQSVKPVDYARSYPVKLPPGPVRDVQVFRNSWTLDFTNTTAEPLGPGTVWLNRWYSRPLPKAIAVGQTVSLPLLEFRDEFGEAFKPGGFFATESPTALVLCQIETPREGQDPEIIGLVTVQSFAE